MVVGVVVALLAVPQFVTGGEHGRALRQKQTGQQGALQTLTKLLHRGVVCLALNAAVPAQVVGGAVAVVFQVGVVTSMVKTDKITQGEAIV